MKPPLISFSLLVFVVKGVIGQTNCLNIDLQKDLIAHFPLDGNAIEAMGSGFDGTVNGAVLTSDRQLNPGTAYVFDGSNDFIHVGDHFDLGISDFSISCWVNVVKFTGRIPGTNTSGGPVINKGLTIFGSPPRAGYGFSAREFQGQHYFDFYVGGQNNDIYRVGGSGYEEDRWYLLIGIKEVDSIKFYVDNQFVAGSLIPANTNVNTNIPLILGSIDKLGNDPVGTNYLNGKIDDVRIYNRALYFEERECMVNSCNPPVVDLGDDRNICDNTSLILDASGGGSTYRWQDGSTQPTFEATHSGIYSVEVENTCGISHDTVEVVFNTPPIVDLGDMITVCDDTPVLLDASHPGSSYTWQNGSTLPTLKVTQPGVYSVEVTNICGTGQDSVNIMFRELDDLKIPNVFTPNDDDVNEYFEIDERLIGSEVRIFGRWGKMVYRNDNYQNDWDGGNLPGGIYYYLITTKYCGGAYKGWVSILY